MIQSQMQARTAGQLLQKIAKMMLANYTIFVTYKDDWRVGINDMKT